METPLTRFLILERRPVVESNVSSKNEFEMTLVVALGAGMGSAVVYSRKYVLNPAEGMLTGNTALLIDALDGTGSRSTVTALPLASDIETLFP